MVTDGDPVETDVYVGIGSNISPEVNVRLAIAALSGLGRLLGVSTLYRTHAIGGHGPDFINGVVHLRCRGDREAVLAALSDMEDDLGRVRGADRHAPRTIDLDLLVQLPTPPGEVMVVHPDVFDRMFVAAPLAELSPGLVLAGDTGTIGISDVVARLDGPIGVAEAELTREMRELVEP